MRLAVFAVIAAGAGLLGASLGGLRAVDGELRAAVAPAPSVDVRHVSTHRPDGCAPSRPESWRDL
jgi:hypothetical protein